MPKYKRKTFPKKELPDDTQPIYVEPITEDGVLTARQELFCKLYSEVFTPTFGNGTKAYQKAYGCTVETARANASELLANTNILRRVRELINITVNDEMVDAELSKVILQDRDLGVKVQAIKEYNALKSRVTKKLQLSGEVKTTDTEQAKRLDKLIVSLSGASGATTDTTETSEDT